MGFDVLKIRTGYSFRHATGKLEDVMGRLKEIGAAYAPITDRASTFGFYRWSKLAEKAGIPPVFGVELAVARDLGEKKPVVDYWTFIAIDALGPINKLIETATNQFHYQPLLSYDQAVSAAGVAKVTGHRPMLNLGNPDDVAGAIEAGVHVLLAPSSSKAIIRQAIEAGVPLASSSDNRFVAPGDYHFYETLVGRNAEQQPHDQFIQSEEEWSRSVRHLVPDERCLAMALANSKAIAESCTARPQKAHLPEPPRPKSLQEMCEEGAARLGVDLTDPTYAARLEKELGLISVKGFEDYFYIVADIVQWARERMVVGPARGSSCGSLACYLLEITTIDPIPHGLIFERFIDINRNDLPDIDIDFSDQQRHLVFEYISEKYGRDRVARLGTVANFHPRSAMQECGAALGVPRWKTDAVADVLIERSSGDSRALDTLADTIKSTDAGKKLLAEHPEMIIATRFEGHPRHYSQHAAGVVLASKPITEYVAIDSRTGATMCDKKDAEDGYGLLKIDALGLTQLSIFEDALEMANLPRTHLETLPLDDPAAFDVLNKQQWAGIFQFNGLALQSLAKQTRIEAFEDIVNITALARPGALTSGGATAWVNRKNGERVKYPHELFRPHLEETLGVVTYQEQVMNIGREIGDLTWEDVTALRKAMSKSLGKEYFDQFGDRWKQGARKKGIPEGVLDKVWDDLCLSGDTVLINPHPSKGNYRKITLKQLYERGGLGPSDKAEPGGKRRRQSLLMWDGESLKPYENWGVRYSGRKATYRLTTESGNSIKATADHKFMMPDGSWRELKSLSIGDCVMSDSEPIPTARKMPKGTGSGGHNWWHKLNDGEPNFDENRRWLRSNYKNCQVCRDAPYEETHHVNMDHEDHRMENLLAVCRKCHKRLHAAHSGYPKAWQKGRSIFADPVVRIEEFGEEDVYDVHMPDPHNNFLADGIVVHNCAYGAWGFNKSHSVAYGMISYWCCWLKAHFPIEFAAATLSHVDDPSKMVQMLREMAAEGIGYVPVDTKKSGKKWSTIIKDGNKMLLGPLTIVKGLGPKTVEQILGARARGEKMPQRAMKLLTNPKTDIDTLYPIQRRVDELMPDPLERNIITRPTRIIDITEDHKVETTFLIIGVAKTINPRDENETIMVARRGYRIANGPTKSLNLQMEDDSGIIYCKISRWHYERLGAAVVARGRAGKSIYALKGKAMAGRRFLMVEAIRYIGDMEKDQ